MSARTWLRSHPLLLATLALALAAGAAQWLLWWLGPAPKTNDIIGPPRSGYTLHAARVSEFNVAGQPSFHLQTPHLERREGDESLYVEKVVHHRGAAYFMAFRNQGPDGAFVGGLSGALFATKQAFINPQSFLLLLSILFLSAVVVGGAGNRKGVIVGAIVVSFLPELFRPFADFRVLVFGILLVLLANFRPQGLWPPSRSVRAKQVDETLGELEGGAARA